MKKKWLEKLEAKIKKSKCFRLMEDGEGGFFTNFFLCPYCGLSSTIGMGNDARRGYDGVEICRRCGKKYHVTYGYELQFRCMPLKEEDK